MSIYQKREHAKFYLNVRLLQNIFTLHQFAWNGKGQIQILQSSEWKWAKKDLSLK